MSAESWRTSILLIIICYSMAATSTTVPSLTTTPSPGCQEGDIIGYYSCSFICGLNDQWYPETAGGGNIPPGAPHCGSKGHVVPAQCPTICFQGEYLVTCHRCCQDYSSNHCDITCGLGLYVPEGCDPFNPPTTTPSPATITTPTPPPGCPEGDIIGYGSCSFICGLNDQWYPETVGGGIIPPGARRCGNKGHAVPAQCPSICVQGQYQLVPCHRCCQDYSSNHCDITCGLGLYVPEGCDPFNPPTTTPSPPTTTIPTPSPGCQEGDTIGYYSCSFICGLNDQWYPETVGGGRIPPGAPHCRHKGQFVEAQCPSLCIQGGYQLVRCHRCCQDYSSNHCDITCGIGLVIQEGCDPFNPPTIPPRSLTLQSLQRNRPRKLQQRRSYWLPKF